MKISDNTSAGAFWLQVHMTRAITALLVIFAFLTPQHFIDLIGCAAFALGAAVLFAKRRSHFMTEVYDFGDYLKLKFDDEEISVNLADIESVECKDGKDGLDWVAVHLVHDTKLGKLIQFYPTMFRMPSGKIDAWILDFNERISAATITKGK